METIFEIINSRLDEQSLLGKDSLTINEIKNILEQVNVLVSQMETIETTETKKDFCTKEQRDTFNHIMSKISGTKKSDKYSDSVFYMVGDYVYMEQDLKTNNFYIRYSDFWSLFEYKFNLNFQETKQLLHSLLEEHLKCEVNRTASIYLIRHLLEQHLKCEVNRTFLVHDQLHLC